MKIMCYTVKKCKKINHFFDNSYMKIAIKQALIGYSKHEIPVGCVIVDTKKKSILAKSHNLVQTYKNSMFHAEIVAMNEACAILRSKYLTYCDMYVTLEPCVMCTAAISKMRLQNLFYGAYDIKQGGIEGDCNFFKSSTCFHKPEIYSGIMQYESESIIKDFFGKLRKNTLQ